MFDRVRLLASVTALATIGACVLPRHPGTPAALTSEIFVTLHGHALRLHLSKPAAFAPSAPLLVYTTGDAGWWGKDRDIFTHIREWGYPAVGFSAREYVHHLGADALRPGEVARDYQAIIGAAVTAMGLPQPARAVLVGKSRGAGLSVAAAGTPQLRGALAGVLAVGLTGEEEYVHGRVRGSRSRERVMLRPYARLPDVGSVPVAVVQSTHDDYVPAAEARRLFGADTASRALATIDARDHNFGGALDALYSQMRRSLEWIVHR